MTRCPVSITLCGSFARGFTLIELAVVIAIIAILAAVAVPRFDNVAAGAEQAVITDFVQKLYSCRAAHTINTAQLSNDFHDFVMTGQYSAADDHTITLSNLAKEPVRLPVIPGSPARQAPSLACSTRRARA